MRFVVFFVLLAFMAGPAFAVEEDSAGELKGSSGLPLPRFASLRGNEANLRIGPGTRYPIDWVLVRSGMPLEITAEHDVWRRVRDWEGTQGWVHKNTLSGKRMAVVTGAERALLRHPDEPLAVMARLEPGATGQLLSCDVTWCRVKFAGIKGYLRKTEFWGTYANEVFD